MSLLKVWAGKTAQWIKRLLSKGEDQGSVAQKSLKCQMGMVACQ